MIELLLDTGSIPVISTMNKNQSAGRNWLGRLISFMPICTDGRQWIAIKARTKHVMKTAGYQPVRKDVRNAGIIRYVLNTQPSIHHSAPSFGQISGLRRPDSESKV